MENVTGNLYNLVFFAYENIPEGLEEVNKMAGVNKQRSKHPGES
jgi:hypothetical protein